MLPDSEVKLDLSDSVRGKALNLNGAGENHV